MLSYWVLQAINAALTLVLIGFVTGPLTWLFYMIAAPLNARGYDPGSRA
jgi:uroporphyrinogen-III decarboxylase